MITKNYFLLVPFITKRNIEIVKLASEYLNLASVKSTQQVLIGFLPSTFFLTSRFNMYSGNDLLLFLAFPSMKSCIYPDPCWPYASE